MGVSSATGPTPNKGYEAAVMQRVGVMIKQFEEMLPMAGAASDIGKDLLKVLNILTKHVPSGTTTPASEKNVIDKMAMQNAQNAQTNQALRPQPPGGGQQAGGPQQGMAA